MQAPLQMEGGNGQFGCNQGTPGGMGQRKSMALPPGYCKLYHHTMRCRFEDTLGVCKMNHFCPAGNCNGKPKHMAAVCTNAVNQFGIR